MSKPQAELAAQIAKMGGWTAIALVILAPVWIVTVAAAGGMLVEYFYPSTFGRALQAVGLSQFALWQVNAVVAYLATLIKLLLK